MSCACGWRPITDNAGSQADKVLAIIRYFINFIAKSITDEW